MTAAAEPALRLRSTQGRWVLAATVLGSGLAMLDATVVNVALAKIGTDLDAGFAALQWTINAYALTLAALVLLGGSLGDRFGRRRIFLVGVVWFAGASLLCGLAQNVEMLVAARGLQGVGGALLTPGSLAIISAVFSGSDRAAAVGAWSGLGGVAGAIGPFAGGWLVEWSWRAVFLVNLPVAALVVVVALRHVPETRDAEASSRLDLTGTVLAVLGLAALTYALTAAGGAPARALLVGLLGAGCLAAFVVVERGSSHALVPTSLFANRQFSAANLCTVFVYAGLAVVFVLLVLYLQVASGFSPMLAGAALLPVTAVMLLFSARAGALAQRIGPRLPMTLGPGICAAGVLLMARLGAHAAYARDVLPDVTLFGAGLALTVAPLTATVLDAAPGRFAGVASGVNNAVARAGGLLAVAVVPALAGIRGDDYADPAAFSSGYRTAMRLSAALLVLAGVLAWSFIRSPLRASATAPDDVARIPVERCPHCAVAGPPIHPAGGSA